MKTHCCGRPLQDALKICAILDLVRNPYYILCTIQIRVILSGISPFLGRNKNERNQRCFTPFVNQNKLYALPISFIFLQFFDNIQVAMVCISFFFPDYLPDEYNKYRVNPVTNLTQNNETVSSLNKPQENPNDNDLPGSRMTISHTILYRASLFWRIIIPSCIGK